MAVIPDSFLEDIARRFALLGDPTRLKIVRALHESGEAAASAACPAKWPSQADLER